MNKSTWMPVTFLIIGCSVYGYYGVTQNAWKVNLPNLIIYIVIILALFFAQRKKEQLRRRREENENK